MKVTSMDNATCTVRNIHGHIGTWLWRSSLNFDVKLGTLFKCKISKTGKSVAPYCKLNGLETFNLRRELNK